MFQRLQSCEIASKKFVTSFDMWLAYGKAKCFLIYWAWSGGGRRSKQGENFSILLSKIRLGNISKGKPSKARIKCRLENVKAPSAYSCIFSSIGRFIMSKYTFQAGFKSFCLLLLWKRTDTTLAKYLDLIRILPTFN